MPQLTKQLNLPFAHSHARTQADNAGLRRTLSSTQHELESLQERMRRGRWNLLSSELEEARQQLEVRLQADLQWQVGRAVQQHRASLSSVVDAAVAAVAQAAGADAAAKVEEQLRQLAEEAAASGPQQQQEPSSQQQQEDKPP